MADSKEKLLAHLQDAYAMENMIVETLERHLHDVKNFPDVSTAIQRHIEETKNHAIMVKECLQGLGEEPNSLKTTMSSTMGAVQGMMPDLKGEPIITNLKAEYTTEHFEIACYTVIHALAEHLNEKKVMDTCNTIIDQEIGMAEQIMQVLPQCAVQQLTSA